MRTSFRSIFALLAGIIAQGCGDNVNLGDNEEHWFDGDTIAGGSAGAPLAVYAGQNFPMAYTVDDTTLYASFGYRDAGSVGSGLAKLKSCELVSCASTVHTLYEQRWSGPPFTPLMDLAVSGPDVFFSSVDALGAPTIVTCPRAGCVDVPRQVTQTRSGNLYNFLATEEGIYWHTGSSLQRCDRNGCVAPATRDLDALTRVSSTVFQQLGSFVVEGDYVYITGPTGLGRLKRDLSADLDWVFVNDRPVQGIAVAGDWVYFGISTLVGEVRRCPVSGCAGGPEVVVSGQRWPSWVGTDRQTLYWLNFTADPMISLPGSIVARPLDGSADPRPLVMDVPFMHDSPTLRMNAHHFYWAEPTGVGAKIRALAK